MHQEIRPFFFSCSFQNEISHRLGCCTVSLLSCQENARQLVGIHRFLSPLSTLLANPAYSTLTASQHLPKMLRQWFVIQTLWIALFVKGIIVQLLL